MRTEYQMIVDAGFLLQLDDARAAVTYDRMVPPAKLRRTTANGSTLHMDVLNHAIEGLPPDRIRYHVCWGSWPGPHTTDVPLKDIVDLILKVNVGAYVIEGANPRHEHEWKVWQDVKLPEGKVLIPGVISHATNVVEHPELVAERIVRLCAAGRTRERDRRHRLRLRAGAVPPPRPPLDHVGEARGAGRGRADREQGAVVVIVCARHARRKAGHDDGVEARQNREFARALVRACDRRSRGRRRGLRRRARRFRSGSGYSIPPWAQKKPFAEVNFTAMIMKITRPLRRSA